MISRQGALAALGALVLVGTVGAATTTAMVASAATEDTRAAAAAWTPFPSPTFHPLAERPDPTPTTVVVSGAYSVRPLRSDDVLVTRAQLKAEYLRLGWEGKDPADPHGDIYLTQREMTVRCMADRGFFYDPRITTDPPDFPGSDAERALSGDPGNTGSSYDWRRAGCYGLAVHETGQDDAH